MGGIPIEMMDRELASIPDLQIKFLNEIVLPLFELINYKFLFVSN